jgi:hypothetical protein
MKPKIPTNEPNFFIMMEATFVKSIRTTFKNSLNISLKIDYNENGSSMIIAPIQISDEDAKPDTSLNHPSRVHYHSPSLV